MSEQKDLVVKISVRLYHQMNTIWDFIYKRSKGTIDFDWDGKIRQFIEEEIDRRSKELAFSEFPSKVDGPGTPILPTSDEVKFKVDGLGTLILPTPEFPMISGISNSRHTLDRKVVLILASERHFSHASIAEKEHTLNGFIVIRDPFYLGKIPIYRKSLIHDIQIDRIELADIIHVINPDSFIHDANLCSCINYAKQRNKIITYMIDPSNSEPKTALDQGLPTSDTR